MDTVTLQTESHSIDKQLTGNYILVWIKSLKFSFTMLKRLAGLSGFSPGDCVMLKILHMVTLFKSVFNKNVFFYI